MVTPSPPQPRPRQLHRRVSYIVSSDLIEASDALPSNVGRSSLVHSLAHHLDLLDVSTASDYIECGDESTGSDDNTGDGESSNSPRRETEQAKLLKILNEGSSNVVDDGPRHLSLHRASVLTPEPATDAQLTSYHSPRYIRALFNEPSTNTAASRPTRGRSPNTSSEDESSDSSEDEEDDETFGLVDDCPRFPQLASHVRQVAGAAISAAKALLPNGEGTPPSDVAICWDGGRHHAHKARAAGFCYINDAVLAIMELKRPRKVVLPAEAVEKEQQADVETDQQGSVKKASPSLPLGFGARPEEIKAAAAAAAAAAAFPTRAEAGPSCNPLKRPGPTSPSSSATNDSKPRRPPASPRKRRTILQRLDRILYLDLDLHWGDGVEEAFSSGSTATTSTTAEGSSSSSSKPTTPSVLTLSLHNSSPGFYPPAPPLNTTTASTNHMNVPLPPHLGRSTTIDRLRTTCLEPLLDAYEPQAIVVQCGVDGLAGDPCKAWRLDAGCLLRCVGSVVGWAQRGGEGGGGGEEVTREARAKVLLLGGGGYNSPNAARAWACMTALALGRMRLPWDEESDDEEEEDDDYNYYYPPEGTLMLSTPIPLSLASWPLFTADGGDDCLDVPAALRREAEAVQVKGKDGENREGNGGEDEDELYLREIESMFARRVEELRSARGLSGKKMVC